MADENTTPIAAPVVENATPVADTPGVAPTPPSAPVVETPTAPAAPTAAPAAPSTPETPAVPAEPAKPDEVAKPAQSTVLGKTPEASKAPGETPAAETPSAETPVATDEGGQSADAAPLPTYESFTLPEGVSFDEGRLADFTKTLGEFQVASKVDQAAMQQLGQKLVERHIAEVEASIKRVAENYSKQWEKQTSEWFESFKNDPEIGKNKFETTQNSVLEAVGKYAGNEAQLNEFKSFMNTTGVGNNPSVIRLISNMNSEIQTLRTKYESEDGVKPLAASKPASEKKGFLQGMYGNMK